MVFNNLVKLLKENNATIKPLYIETKDSQGTGLCNASILYSENKIRVILRNVEYTLFHSENEQLYQSRFEGPLSYYHKDNDLSLRTYNFYLELDENTLEIIKYSKIDTSQLDTKPIWNFIGLEDARLTFWNNKYYLCGVRRDTTTTGQGRIELSEIEINDDNVKEINRNRIEVQDKDSYCEKNWMPIKNRPFTFVKWTNPTEVVQVDLDSNLALPILLSNIYYDLPFDIRGGSQLISWNNDQYLSIVHECNFIPKNYNGYKDAEYYHRFIIWNSDLTINYISENFNFMTAKTEFCIGLEQVNNDIIIIFGFQDNCSFIIKICKDNLLNILNNKLKNCI